MAWQRIVGSAAVVLVGLSAGCESSPTRLARNQFLQDPELLSAIGRNGGQEAENARGQKPDARATSNLLDVSPQRPADVPNNPSAVNIVAVVNDQAILDEEVR